MLSCSGPAPHTHSDLTKTDRPLVAGEPEGYDADDVAFGNNIIRQHQQGIDMSALVPDRSTNQELIALAAKTASALRFDIATLRALLVQWAQDPNVKTGNDGYGVTTKGLLDQATIAKLDSLRGSEFDTLWLRSTISADVGVIEMANAEIANGKNADAIGLAKQIVDVQGAEISSMKQILGS